MHTVHRTTARRNVNELLQSAIVRGLTYGQSSSTNPVHMTCCECHDVVSLLPVRRSSVRRRLLEHLPSQIETGAWRYTLTVEFLPTNKQGRFQLHACCAPEGFLQQQQFQPFLADDDGDCAGAPHDASLGDPMTRLPFLASVSRQPPGALLLGPVPEHPPGRPEELESLPDRCRSPCLH